MILQSSGVKMPKASGVNVVPTPGLKYGDQNFGVPALVTSNAHSPVFLPSTSAVLLAMMLLVSRNLMVHTPFFAGKPVKTA